MQRIAPIILFCLTSSVVFLASIWADDNMPAAQRFAFSAKNPDLYLDLFEPSMPAKSSPAVLCLHGGGWMKGSPESIHKTAAEFAVRGYIAVASSYRLTDTATFPAQLEDVVDALRWMKSKEGVAAGIDPDRVFVMGSSAGGHLAVLVGVHDDVPRELRPVASFGIGAQTDFTAPHVVSAAYTERARFYLPFVGSGYRENPQGYLAASPLHHLDAGDSPVGFLTGELDQKTTHAIRFRKEAFRLGVPTTFSTIKGAPHALLNKETFRKEAVDRIVDFFDRSIVGGGRLAIEWKGAQSILDPVDTDWLRLGGDYNGCEGAQWLEGEGEQGPTLIFAAHHDNLAFSWREETGLLLLAEDTPEASTWRPAGSGSFFVLEQQTRQLAQYDRQGNREETLLSGWDGRQFNRPNDLVIRPGKRGLQMWMTDPQYSFRTRPLERPEYDGQYVFRINRDETGSESERKLSVEPFIRDLETPNGIAFDSTGETLYVGDSGTKKIFAYSLSQEGAIREKWLFAQGFQALDGLAVDPHGRVWVGARDAAIIFDAKGEKLGQLILPEMVSSIAFSRADESGERWVAVTTKKAAHVARFRF